MANLIKTIDLQTRQCLKATNVILNKFSINNHKNEGFDIFTLTREAGDKHVKNDMLTRHFHFEKKKNLI